MNTGKLLTKMKTRGTLSVTALNTVKYMSRVFFLIGHSRFESRAQILNRIVLCCYTGLITKRRHKGNIWKPQWLAYRPEFNCCLWYYTNKGRYWSCNYTTARRSSLMTRRRCILLWLHRRQSLCETSQGVVSGTRVHLGYCTRHTSGEDRQQAVPACLRRCHRRELQALHFIWRRRHPGGHLSS